MIRESIKKAEKVFEELEKEVTKRNINGGGIEKREFDKLFTQLAEKHLGYGFVELGDTLIYADSRDKPEKVLAVEEAWFYFTCHEDPGGLEIPGIILVDCDVSKDEPPVVLGFHAFFNRARAFNPLKEWA